MSLVPQSVIRDRWLRTLSQLKCGTLFFTGPDGREIIHEGAIAGPKVRFAVHDWNVLQRAAARGDIGLAEDFIAGKMGVSRQTLFRKLKAEGTSFEKVLDALRHKMALDYLSGKKVSVNETAYLVGFSEPAAFSRAFKRWTGVSPRNLREAEPSTRP